MTLRTLRSKVREKEIADGASTVSFVTTLSSYFLTDFPSNLICSFMVWVRCRAEPCKLDGSTAQTIGTNLGRVAERERSVGGRRARFTLPLTSTPSFRCWACMGFNQQRKAWRRGRGARFHHPPPLRLDQSNLNSFHRIPSITKFDWPLTAKNKSSNNHSLFPWIILCEGNNYRMIIPGKICWVGGGAWRYDGTQGWRLNQNVRQRVFLFILVTMSSRPCVLTVVTFMPTPHTINSR